MGLGIRMVMLWLRYCVLFLVFITKPIFTWLYEGKRIRLKDPKNPLLLKSATELSALIRQRKVKSRTAVEAYIAQIKSVNPFINAVVANRFEDALQEASRVDQILDSNKIPDELSPENAPFLGLPITVKECFAVKGLPQTSGMLARKNAIADKDAAVVAKLRKAGAIVMAVTNVSELCMWMESSNLVYGRTKNAYHHGRIVGGSSGGEACIISAAGSVLGPGSDIGGSIRMPAYFNGIFGHKGTTGIVDNTGQMPMAEKKALTFLSTGPLCRYASDLKPAYKVMAGDDVKKLTLDKKVDLKKLKYYYMEDDGGGNLCVPVDPQLKQALLKAVDHFKNMGATVEKVNIKELKQSFFIWAAEMNNSENADFCVLLSNSKNGRIRPLKEFFMWMIGRPRHTLPAIGLGLLEKVRNPPEVDKRLIATTDVLKRKFRDLLGEDGVFFYPSHPVPAPYHNQPLVMLFNFAYTGIFNMIGIPVTQVPMGMAKEGVPTGIQVAGNFHNDHLTIAVAEELERAFGGWIPPF